MTIEILDVIKTITQAGVDVAQLRTGHSERSPQFFVFHKDGKNVEVESTARSLMEEFTCFPLELQATIFLMIAEKLQHPGEQIILAGDNKKRGARAVRLLSPTEKPDVVQLLLTH